MRSCWELYVFLLIPVAWVIVFCYFPMAGVQIAFRKFSLSQGLWNSPWAGIYQFAKFFRSPQLMRILPNTILVSFYSLITGFPLPIIFALGLNILTAYRYKKFVQTITYVPHFISTVVLVGILFRVFHSRTGLYGVVYQALTNEQPQDLFGKASAFRHLYVWSGIWQNLGWSSIIYVAALSNVSMDLHEAAQDDHDRVRHRIEDSVIARQLHGFRFHASLPPYHRLVSLTLREIEFTSNRMVRFTKELNRPIAVAYGKSPPPAAMPTL